MSNTFSLRQAVGVLATTTVITQLINAGLILVQSHFYTPISVGFLANVLSVATIMSPICTMQLSFAIPQQRSAREIAEIVSLTLLSLCTMFSVLATGCAVYGLLQGTFTTSAKIAAYGLGLVVFLVFYDLGRMLAAREGAFLSIGKQNLASVGSRAVVQIVGGILGGAQFWLVAGEVLGRFASLALVRRGAIQVWHTVRTERLELWHCLRANWRFPVITLPSTVVDNLGGFLPPILISNLYGMQSAGLYFLAQRIVAFPIVLLTQSTADVIQVRAAQIMHDDKGRLFAFVVKTISAFFGLGLGVAIVLLIFVTLFWTLVFGARWAEGQELALALVVSGLPQIVAGPISRILIVTNRQALKLVFDVSYLLATLIPVLAKLAGCHLRLSGAVWYMVGGYFVAYTLYIGLILLSARHPIELKRSNP